RPACGLRLRSGRNGKGEQVIHRPAKAETRAAKLTLFTTNRATHRLRDRADYRQPQAAASGGAVTAGVKAHKRLEHFFALIRGNTGSIILYRQAGLITL